MEDHELDALLRDVPVPPGLNEKLKRIPDELQPVVVRGSSRGSWKIAAVLAMAAGLIGITCWLIWPPAKADLPSLATPDDVRNELKDKLAQNKVPDFDPAQVTNEINFLSEQIAELTWQLESQKQMETLARLRRATSTAGLERQAPAEREALTLYLSGEAARSWGAGNEFVHSEMQQIIDRYPNTDGAVRAQEFLKQSTDL